MLNFLIGLWFAFMTTLFVLGMIASIDTAKQISVLVNEIRNLKQHIIVIEQQLEWLQRNV